MRLRYARVEHERRFLVSAVPDGVQRSTIVVDRYVVGTRLRLRELRKVRHHVRRDGVGLAVDELPDGTLVAEIDDGNGPPVVVPPWLPVITEVTDDEQWTGWGLAQRAAASQAVP